MTRHPALLTVGSTAFTPLVHAFLSPASLLTLAALGHSAALAQVGASELPAGWAVGSSTRHGVTVDIVRFADDLEDRVASAAVVVSHAGAGSILSFMRPKKRTTAARQLVLVPNTTLMDSHQADLADELAARGWADVCTPENLPATLAALAALAALTAQSEVAAGPADAGRAKYPPLDPARMARIVDSTLGFA